MPVSRVATVIVAALLAACADGPSAVLSPDDRDEANSGVVAEPIRELSLTLYGRGMTIETFLETSAGEKRSLSSTIVGSTRDVPVGVPRDTTLQYLFAGEPAIGEYTLPAQSVEVMYFGWNPMLVHKEGDENAYTAGTPNLMLFSWPQGVPAPAREVVQSEPATVTITEYRAPTIDRADGMLRGTIAYVGEEWMRVWAPDGRATMHRTGVRYRIVATMDVTWERSNRHIEPPAPGS
jgi:hypothetical protein